MNDRDELTAACMIGAEKGKEKLAAITRERDALRVELDKLREYKAEIAASTKRIMNEKCHTDEIHCSCVPLLRAEVERLTELLKADTDAKKMRVEMGKSETAFSLIITAPAWLKPEEELASDIAGMVAKLHDVTITEMITLVAKENERLRAEIERLKSEHTVYVIQLQDEQAEGAAEIERLKQVESGLGERLEWQAKNMVKMVDEYTAIYKADNERLRKALDKISRIACGEDQVANDDTEGMGVIYRLAIEALSNGKE